MYHLLASEVPSIYVKNARSIPKQMQLIQATIRTSLEGSKHVQKRQVLIQTSLEGLMPVQEQQENGYIDHSAKPVASVPISRDEEEVAETLFALAGMIPLSDLHTRNKTDCEPLESKKLDLAEKPENSMPVSGGFSSLLSSVVLLFLAFVLCRS
ncbi:hypothetical protein Cgig2_008956 [Carnegiea gigantea]|uniref:Uncharacterized protein n=1 Tax=Carnegiea gigantea TaxID=171969 RepID=A0A9Q1GST7_9CARY|nr:hypothetical protein Cgig2_008956 [Carnegiea gigantea]